MSHGLVKSELVCPELWGTQERLSLLPCLRQGDLIYLNFVVHEVGKVEGMFEVVDVLHILEARGYVQRLRIKPERS